MRILLSALIFACMGCSTLSGDKSTKDISATSSISNNNRTREISAVPSVTVASAEVRFVRKVKDNLDLIAYRACLVDTVTLQPSVLKRFTVSELNTKPVKATMIADNFGCIMMSGEIRTSEKTVRTFEIQAEKQTLFLGYILDPSAADKPIMVDFMTNTQN